MTTETKKIVNVTSKMLSMEMDEKNCRAAGAVKINSKDYRYTVKEDYNEKISVVVQSFFNDEELKNLGIEVDHTEIINAFKANLKVIKAKKAAAVRAERERAYDESPLHQVLKLIPKEYGTAHLSCTKEEYVKGDSFRHAISICIKEVHQGVVTEYYITHDPVYSSSSWSSNVKGYRFNIQVSGHYDREFKKWSTTAEKAVIKFNELREMINRRIDAKIENKKQCDNTFNKMKKLFGDNVEQKSERDYKDTYSTVTYLSSKKNKDDKLVGVKFSPDDKGYRINRIYGTLTVEQVKAIMNIVKDATPVYSFH